MNLLRCLLFLALLAAVSATACGVLKGLKRHGHGHGHGHHHHKHRCGHKHGHHDRPEPAHSCGGPKCGGDIFLTSLGMFSRGISDKLRMSKSIFGWYSGKPVSADLDACIELLVNMSRGMSLVLNEIAPGLGGWYQKVIMGSTKLMFCMLGEKWEGGSFFERFFVKKKYPSVCGNDFGKRWGWRCYKRGYKSYEALDAEYGFSTCKADVENLLADAGIEIKNLKGTKKLIIEIFIQIATFVQRPIHMWSMNDYVLLCRYCITVVAACGKSVKHGTGYTIVEELISYISIVLKNANFKEDLWQYESVIKKDLDSCTTYNFNGAIIVNGGDDENKDNEDKNDSTVKKSNKAVTVIKQDIKAQGSGAASSSSEAEESSKQDASANADANASATVVTTVTTQTWDEYYDENGKLINSTRVDS